MHHSPTRHIRSRRSVRRFRPDPVPEAVLRDILDCGRLAPTARNLQPWLLGAVTDQELRHRISDLARYGGFIRQSPVCFAVFTLASEKYYLEDGCAAAMNIIIAAAAHGLSTCWVAGDKKEYAPRVREILGVPSEYTLVALVACGYADEEPRMAKKTLEEVAFRDRYE
ncbi:MAG: nitroreductase family protein [bacterium]|nr:MAG: nitroreductase family protein [bacterium]